MHNYILLDRSGSMETKWVETISSINAYVDELVKSEATKESLVTLACFDYFCEFNFDVLRKALPANTWKKLGVEEASPRGITPLYDAIGELISLAEKDNHDKAVIVIITDGHENNSKEMTMESAKSALDRARNRNWQVIFLAADFEDIHKQASSLGNRPDQTLNTRVNRVGAMARTARLAECYVVTGSNMSYSQEDRNFAER